MRGRVMRVLSDRFSVRTDTETVFVKSRKKLKSGVRPLPGDFVVLEKAEHEYVLCGIEPRKNESIRPPIANVEQIVITIAPVPVAELSTVDKMLINAHRAGIRTVVCVNKSDLTPHSFFAEIEAQYAGVADSVIGTCAAHGEVDALRAAVNGRFSCLAGQSAVGKTSLINAICGTRRQVGDLSEKILRGKNTTTDVELIDLGNGTFVADTPGFAVLDLRDMEAADLPLYYEEYVRLSGECKYHMCTHTNEPECAVRAAVAEGALNGHRYERYCKLFDELKQQNKYKKARRYAYENK